MEATGEPSARSSSFAECARIVQEADPDRAVSIGFAPPEKRDALWALYAFDTETARIRDHVSQPLPGEIRLQWWRDRLHSEDVEPEAAGQGSPVASAMVDTIRRHKLPLEAMDRYLDSRIFDLYDDPMGDRAEFETYAGETTSTIVMLGAMILDREAAPHAADAAGHAGVAECAAKALRLVERHRSRHQIYAPADILRATGVSPTAWLAGGDEVRPAVSAIIAYGREHLRLVETALPDTPRSIRPALLPALFAARTIGEDPASSLLPLRRLWAYWRMMRR